VVRGRACGGLCSVTSEIKGKPVMLESSRYGSVSWLKAHERVYGLWGLLGRGGGQLGLSNIAAVDWTK
jgi:hypothetical protein